MLAHIPDVANFVDFWTKWVAEAKVEASVAYLTGSKARAAHSPDTAEAAAMRDELVSVMAIAAAWEAYVELVESAL